jgi:hypothetical protein
MVGENSEMALTTMAMASTLEAALEQLVRSANYAEKAEFASHSMSFKARYSKRMYP